MKNCHQKLKKKIIHFKTSETSHIPKMNINNKHMLKSNNRKKNKQLE